MAFTLRPSVEQQAAWEGAAEEDGRSLASWITRVCDAAARVPVPADRVGAVRAAAGVSPMPVVPASLMLDAPKSALAAVPKRGCPLPSPGHGVRCKACGKEHG